MKVYKFFFSFFAFLVSFTSLSAQNVNKKDSLLNNMVDINARLKEFSTKDATKGFSTPLVIDTAYIFRVMQMESKPRDANGLLIVPREWTPFSDRVSFRDTVIFEPAFLPVVFDGKLLSSKIDFLPKDTTMKGMVSFHLISPDSTFAPAIKRIRHIEDMRRQYYTNNPQKIRLNALAFSGKPVIDEEVVERRNPFKEFISTEDVVGLTTPEIEKIRIKPVHWLKNGEHIMQLSFNTYSKKWGGDNNFNLYSNQKFNFNYKKKKIGFNNLIEWRLQLQQITSVDDDEKAVNKNKDKITIIEDYVRSYSTFGVDAFKKWAYSANLEMKTPIFSKRTNDAERVKQRAFLSPFELNAGIGMRYATENVSKVNKYRKFNLSADLSVLSINYKYVRDDSIPSKWFGLEEGKNSQTDFGSTFNVNLSYNYNRYTKFTSRLKYFTNYEKVYAEWENSFNFALNRYFSTTLYLYVKYDDGIPVENKDPDFSYFNYNQMVRFGLTYTW